MMGAVWETRSSLQSESLVCLRPGVLRDSINLNSKYLASSYNLNVIMPGRMRRMSLPVLLPV